jgi:hypothetical protein
MRAIRAPRALRQGRVIPLASGFDGTRRVAVAWHDVRLAHEAPGLLLAPRWAPRSDRGRVQV